MANPPKRVSFKDTEEIIPYPCDNLKIQVKKPRGFSFMPKVKSTSKTGENLASDAKEQNCLSHASDFYPGSGSLESHDELVRQFGLLKMSSPVTTSIFPHNEPDVSTSTTQLSENSGKFIQASSRSAVEFLPQFGGRRPDFSTFIDDNNQFLCLKPINGAPVPSVRRPLGIAFDEILQEWMVADTCNHRVLFIPSNKCVRKDFVKPGAIAVFQEGISFVVLDEKSVHFFTHNNDGHRVVANIDKPARGIAVTSYGHIIIMKQKTFDRYSQHIVIYNSSGYDEVIYQFKYVCGGSPSFIHFYNGMLSVTDLSNQTVSMYRVAEDKQEVIKVTQVNALQRRGSGRDPDEGTFKFVSGVFHDRKGLRLIADAYAHSLFLFDKDGPIQRISCEQRLPYISGVWVSQTGVVALCDRSVNAVRFYQLVGVPSKLPYRGGLSTRGTPQPTPSKSQQEDYW